MSDSFSDDDDEVFLKPKKNLIKKDINNTKITNNTKNINNKQIFSYSEREITAIDINKKEKGKDKGKENIIKNIEKKEVEDIKKEEQEIKENNNNLNKKDFDNNNINKEFENFTEVYSYLKIDQKNYFSEMTNEDYEYLKRIISSYNENTVKETKIKTINEIIKKFLEKISPNCEADPLLISKYLSKEIFKFKKLTKIKLEEYINYFFSFRYDLLYSTNFCLNLKTIKYLGYILSYMFSKFHKYSIKDGKEFRHLIKKTIEKRIDVLMDYYKYINENNIKETDNKSKKSFYWKKNRNKYIIPPELNFLINRFIKIKTIEIELDFQGEIIDEENFKLISIFLLNVNYIFVNLTHLKINFINQNLQYELYSAYFRDLLQGANVNRNIIKKNRIKYPELLYDKKWNFQYNFNLEEYRIIDMKKNKDKFNNKNLIYDDYNLLYFNNTKKELSQNQMFNSTIQKSKNNENETNIIEIQNNKNNIIKEDENNLVKKNGENDVINNIIKGKNNYSDTIKNNSKFFDLLAMLICSIGRLNYINNLDIIMNDSYNNEFIINLLESYDIDGNLIDNNFHILDFIYNKIRDIKKLNIEINGLDSLTFSKVLNLIHKNQKLNSFQISLFSSDAIYFRMSLLKLYNQIIDNAENLIKIINSDIESKILNDLLPFFVQNLSVLFELLKKYKDIEILGFNFDLPSILINKNNYIKPILKFIINILFLIDSHKCKLQKLTILSPSIVIDNKILTGANDMFSDINIGNNNKILNELNIQIQFYKIKDIKNIISQRLIKLNIGDLDIITFSHLIKFLISYKFCSNSKLESLGIGLNKAITCFNTELKILFRDLFNIKLNNLLELNLYTNVIINNKNNYEYLMDILKDNWISSLVIILNSQSNDILNKFKNLKNNIKFFVHPKLTKKLIKEKNNNNININNQDNNDIIYWFLKYLFDYKYYNSSSNFTSKKICINSILKYLYIEKNIKIKHSLENDEEMNNEGDVKE